MFHDPRPPSLTTLNDRSGCAFPKTKGLRHLPGACVALLLVLGVTAPILAGAAESRVHGRDCPVVLVHGFNGWGRDEMLGFLYWGGTILDIEKRVATYGMRGLTASVGPYSSNHDRACELFWQIKGGRLDFGEQHAAAFGHKRFGETWPGLYPQWDAAHPVHLVGHSMGGQTIRLLTELLARDYFGAGTNERWVFSLTTISTPHNGTTLVEIVGNLLWHQAEKILAAVMALASGSENIVCDFDLDQWDLQRQPGESVSAFLSRARRTLGNTRDISSWDLSIKGAHELNRQIRVFPCIYYMSYSNRMTYRLPGTDINLADMHMNPVLWPAAAAMGNYAGRAVPPGQAGAWQPNDGIVNTLSMRGPANSPIVDWATGPVQPGIWTHMGTVATRDHGTIIGLFQNPLLGSTWLEEFVDGIFSRLATLER